MTVTGRTIAQNTARAKILDEQVIRQPAHAYSQEGGLAILRGNLAPDGAVSKQPVSHHPCSNLRARR